MDLRRDRAARSISLGQHRLTTDLLSKYGMDDCKPLSTPLSTSTKLTAEGEPLDGTPLRPAHGQPDVPLRLHSPGHLSSRGSTGPLHDQAHLHHWQAAKDVLRYLNGTSNYGITFGGATPRPHAYCDADYAGDLDTRRSTTGYVFILNGGAISWSSRLQQTVAASTTEAEYMAAAAAIKEALWLRTLLSDLHLNITTVNINADSQSAIKLLKNPVFSMRSKHIDVIYHFARERVTRKDITFTYIKTDHMVADALTKPVPATKFNFCRNEMGITDPTKART